MSELGDSSGLSQGRPISDILASFVESVLKCLGRGYFVLSVILIIVVVIIGIPLWLPIAALGKICSWLFD